MAKNVNEIAHALKAEIIGTVPETGSGAFGAARLASILHARLVPSSGLRPGRPSDPNWVKHPKVPMSSATFDRLQKLAGEFSTPDRRISPMQVAAQLLESSVEELVKEN